MHLRCVRCVRCVGWKPRFKQHSTSSYARSRESMHRNRTRRLSDVWRRLLDCDSETHDAFLTHELSSPADKHQPLFAVCHTTTTTVNLNSKAQIRWVTSLFDLAFRWTKPKGWTRVKLSFGLTMYLDRTFLAFRNSNLGKFNKHICVYCRPLNSAELCNLVHDVNVQTGRSDGRAFKRSRQATKMRLITVISLQRTTHQSPGVPPPPSPTPLSRHVTRATYLRCL